MNAYHQQLNSNEQPKNSKLKLAVLCFTLLLIIVSANQQLIQLSQQEYCTPILIGWIIAFFLGCLSSYTGQKNTLIAASIFHGITYFIKMIFIPSNIAQMWIYALLYSTTLQLILIGLISLMFQYSPGEFVKVYSLLLLLASILEYIGQICIPFNNAETQFLVFAFFINALLIYYIFDPIVNETKTIYVILVEIKAVLCNLKVIIFIFTVLLCSTVGFLGSIQLNTLGHEQEYIDMIKNTDWIFSIIGVAFLRRKPYQPTLVILFTMITIVVGSLLLIVFQLILNGLGMWLIELGGQLLVFYQLPALEAILINHGVQNIHIVSSFIVIEGITILNESQLSTYIYLKSNENLEQALYFFNVIFICLILVLVVFIIIYYKISVYKNPIQQIFPRQAVAPEQNVQMLQNIEL